MKLKEVDSIQDKRSFLELPKLLYKNDPNWVCPLDAEVEAIFETETNNCFENGEAIRWLLCDDENGTIGRIAVFIDRNKLNHHKYLAGGCGFFECIDNQKAANILFEAAKDWLKSKGAEAMQGPINFGENFHNWGLLVDGFMTQGYGMPYNPPYYQKLFESYGFKNYFEQYSYHKPLSEGWPEKYLKLAKLSSQRRGYSFKRFSFEKIDEFVAYFVEVYNSVWSAYHDSYTPLNNIGIKKMLVDSKQIVDEDLMIFAFDNDRPVGILLSIPDINPVLKKIRNGKLNLLNKFKFLYYKSRIVTRNRALLAGVIPEYQNSGIAIALFYQLVVSLEDKPKQKEIELGWVADYNPKMIGIYDKIGAKRMKTHYTYMYQFDQSLPFQRFTNEFEEKKY